MLFLKEMPKSAAITKRILLHGKLRLLSPLIIGGGRSYYGDSDIVVLKDENGHPIIPSSSVIGALKHSFEDYKYLGSKSNYEWNKLWFWGGHYQLKKDGELIKKSCQSAFYIKDMTISKEDKSKITIRDGIKIDRKKGVVEQGKNDYEIVEPGIIFDCKMEVIIREEFDIDLFKSFFNWVTVTLAGGNFAIGARTRQGFGLCQLEDVIVYEFDYKNKDHVTGWLVKDYAVAQISHEQNLIPKDFALRNKEFTIEAGFMIKHSLIIGSYSGNPKAPDKVHIKGRNKFGEETAILPATSIRGAIRSRAEKIMTTLGSNGVDELKKLFGWVDNKAKEGEREDPIRGRISFKEQNLGRDKFSEEIQHRIKIDRFTGGVINNALFDSMPLWAKESDEPMVNLDLRIKSYEDWEAGLMLLVLKDLWTGDLPVGGEKNVGRGVLEGLFAVINCGDVVIEIKQNNEKLLVYRQGEPPTWDEETAIFLENKVVALLEYIEAEGNGVKLDA